MISFNQSAVTPKLLTSATVLADGGVYYCAPQSLLNVPNAVPSVTPDGWVLNCTIANLGFANVTIRKGDGSLLGTIPPHSLGSIQANDYEDGDGFQFDCGVTNLPDSTQVLTKPSSGNNSTQTVEDSVIFNGPANLLNHQSATAGKSPMTRDLVDDEPIWSMGGARLLPFAGMKFASSGTGAAAGIAQYDNAVRVACGSAANGYGRATLETTVTSMPSYTGTGINFSKPITLAGVFASNTGETGALHCARFIVGGNGGVPASQENNAISAKGFGLEIYYDTTAAAARVKVFGHNGTTYATSGPVSGSTDSPHFDRITHFILTSNGAGTIKLYLASGGPPSRPALVYTSASAFGPTGIGSASATAIDMVCVSNSTTNPTQTNAAVNLLSAMLAVGDSSAALFPRA